LSEYRDLVHVLIGFPELDMIALDRMPAAAIDDITSLILVAVAAQPDREKIPRRRPRSQAGDQVR
jgi:hypothetical protein